MHLLFLIFIHGLYAGKGHTRSKSTFLVCRHQNIQNYGATEFELLEPSMKYPFDFNVCNDSDLRRALHPFTPWNGEFESDNCFVKVLLNKTESDDSFPCNLCICMWYFNGNETMICSLFPSHYQELDSPANKSFCCALFVRWRQDSRYFLSVLDVNGSETLFHAKTALKSNDSTDDMLDFLVYILLSQQHDLTAKHHENIKKIHRQNSATALELFGVICGYILVIFVMCNGRWLLQEN